MNTWKHETPEPPRPRATLHTGDVSISVSEDVQSGKRWQYLTMSFGKFSEEGFEDCQASWPKLALTLAREQLDKFEATLD